MVEGSCLCGEVAFELDGALSEIELCHCRKCRKAYGAAFSATIYCTEGAFKWTRGEAFVRTYDAPIEESPPAYRHSFCGTCGSTLPLVWARLPFVEVLGAGSRTLHRAAKRRRSARPEPGARDDALRGRFDRPLRARRPLDNGRTQRCWAAAYARTRVNVPGLAEFSTSST